MYELLKLQAGDSARSNKLQDPKKAVVAEGMTIQTIASANAISVPRLQQLNRMDDDVLQVRVQGASADSVAPPTALTSDTALPHLSWNRHILCTHICTSYW
eukprot:4188734-Pyramimonas_sp.AAC.1